MVISSMAGPGVREGIKKPWQVTGAYLTGYRETLAGHWTISDRISRNPGRSLDHI